MKLAIMQPYFLPYIGYFQLIAAADVFVVYDNIKYTKKGWINRNRILRDGREVLFSLPLKSDSDSMFVCERQLALDFNRGKLLDQFSNAYRRAPYFARVFPLLEEIVLNESSNLFAYLYNSIVRVCSFLELDTQIYVSSKIEADHQLKGQERVLALCNALGSSTYINASGGVELYDRESFQMRKVALKFLRSKAVEYSQLSQSFVPFLSIVDVLMCNSATQVNAMIRDTYELF